MEGNFWALLPVSGLELFVKGVLIGIAASIPMGPVGILCVQRTLQKGRAYGLMTGMGATLSDLFYALITGLGMSFAMDFIEDERNLFVLQLLGSALLLAFGLYMFKTKMRRKLSYVNRHRGTLIHNGLTGFLITLSNPGIIFLFMALFARFAFMVPEHEWEQSLGFLGIMIGAMAWWYILTYAVDRLREIVSDRTIHIFNKTVGVIVIIVAIVGAIITLFHLKVTP